ncbi:dihydrodipicolinate synthase family protein [Jiulongibacter sediminis]|uniref:Dihydrodipicolinate synthetase n=1 Tax=Jiulongibacter sediminis TaxID=1605367 RepID=A0A0P7C5U0_9BACT|nr:dihydrodipicolinate synthase family protein [Jiulongibacter sediminis]KPM49685.1 hypothetical protein AFM12_03590 [Jiulongibacter sediminis]TBX26723.1 hypothetical protein TK44_03595 [Jiulongibacter sediminis]
MRGIISPVITPLNADGSLDQISLGNITERMISAGIAGVFVSGTTGEFSSLSYDFKVNLGKSLIEIVKGRVPVLTGISSTIPLDSVEQGKVAKTQGADFVVATPPYYLKMNQEEVFDYYTWLVSEIKLPLYLYNIPSLTKVSIEKETVLRLSENPGIVGLKDSSGDLEYFQNITEQFTGNDFEIFMGPEEILREALKNGANGGVNGGSNIFPEWYIELYHAHQAGDKVKVDTVQQKILKFSDQVYAFTNDENAYLKGLKAAMAIKGLCQNHLSNPLKAYSEEQLEQIAQILKNF